MRYFAIVLTLLLCQSALAAAKPEAPHCGDTHSTPELNACELKLYEAADRVLNSEYKKTRTRLPAPAQADLLKEQRAWIKRRDPTCTEELRGEEGGTIWTSLFYQCQAEATRERTKALRAWQPK